MVHAVRLGRSMSVVAKQFNVSVSTVSLWVKRGAGQRLDRCSFVGGKPGRAWNRTPAPVEQQVLQARVGLRERSALGEYGADAIGRALQAESRLGVRLSRATINRVLRRYGATDAQGRVRRPSPPKGWYLPDLAAGRAELDSFDFIEELKIAQGPLVSVLSATSVHGVLPDAWVMERPSAQATLTALLERWRREGLPTYAQFDNDTIFQGAHQFPDAVGRIIRLCLALKIVPVFAPPREPGFQNAVEGFNARWQAKVWQRYPHPDVSHLANASQAYIAAYRAKTAARCEQAPERRPFPKRFTLDLNAPLKGSLIFLRRTDDHGRVHLLGQSFSVDDLWIHRLVRCEVDFSTRRIRFYALRRKAPAEQRLLKTIPYHRPHKPFQGTP